MKSVIWHVISLLLAWVPVSRTKKSVTGHMVIRRTTLNPFFHLNTAFRVTKHAHLYTSVMPWFFTSGPMCNAFYRGIPEFLIWTLIRFWDIKQSLTTSPLQQWQPSLVTQSDTTTTMGKMIYWYACVLLKYLLTICLHTENLLFGKKMQTFFPQPCAKMNISGAVLAILFGRWSPYIPVIFSWVEMWSVLAHLRTALISCGKENWNLVACMENMENMAKWTGKGMYIRPLGHQTKNVRPNMSTPQTLQASIVLSFNVWKHGTP